jgi:hypothetical protein
MNNACASGRGGPDAWFTLEREVPLLLGVVLAGSTARGKRSRARVIAAMVVALASVTVVAHARAARAAGTPQVTVTPNSGLQDQVVQLSWSGFAPTDTIAGTDTVSVYQCKGDPKTLDDCYVDKRPSAGGTDVNGTGDDGAQTNPDGTGSDQIEVRPASYLPVLDCTAAAPCSIVVFVNDGSIPAPGHLPNNAIVVPISFAKSPSDCPRVPAPDVTTEGSASTSHALYTWSAQMCTGAHPLALDYTETASPAGRRDFIAGAIDVGLTSMRATAAEARTATRSYSYAPIDLSAVAIAFNVRDTVTGQKITDMKLTPRLVALLLAGDQIAGPGRSLFSDPEFLALNPDHSWPAATQPPLMRAERNADTWLLTNWVEQDDAARKYLYGQDPTAAVDPYWKEPPVIYPTDTFETRDPDTAGYVNPRTGTLINIRRLFNFQPPGDGVSISIYDDALLGITDLVTAETFGLPVASIVPDNAPAGSSFVAPDATSLAKGYDAMAKQTGPGGTTLMPNSSATGGAYPLVKVDYAMVPTSNTTRVKAGHIAQFLDYAATTGQQGANLSPGYVPMPAVLRTQAESAAAAVVAAARSSTPPTGGSHDTGNGSPGSTTGSTPTSNSSTATNDGGTPSNSFVSGGSPGSGTGSTGGVTPADASSAGGNGNGDTTAPSGLASGPITPAIVPTRTSPIAFLGARDQFLLPTVFVLGLLALAGGPILSIQARKKVRAEKKANAPTSASRPPPMPPLLAPPPPPPAGQWPPPSSELPPLPPVGQWPPPPSSVLAPPPPPPTELWPPPVPPAGGTGTPP